MSASRHTDEFFQTACLAQLAGKELAHAVGHHIVGIAMDYQETGTSLAQFNGSGAAAMTDVDADRWTAPAGLAAGGSATFRFPLNTTGEAQMPEVFRIKPTSASGTGTLRVTVNGADLGTKAVGPGRTTRWFVPETLLLAGATNVLQVTRTDAGGTPVNIDVASFGGSLQYGERDNSHYEFAMEGKYQNPNANVYQLIGANWFDSARALFGANGSSAHTNTVIKFDVPEDILQNYDWRMRFRTATAGHTVSMSLNGTALGNYTSGTEHGDIEIPGGLLRTTGNELKMANTATFKAGSYFAPDYVRLYLVDRPGGDPEDERHQALRAAYGILPTDGNGVAAGGDMAQIAPGHTYEEVDDILCSYLQAGPQPEAQAAVVARLNDAYGAETVERVLSRHSGSAFKRKRMPLVIERSLYES